MLDFWVFSGGTRSAEAIFSELCIVLCHPTEWLQDGFITDLKLVSK